MAALVYILVLLALTGYSSATYCLCKDGVSEQALQKTLDYACGAGADCTPILQNGACYQPNTVKDHCSYAANSYFQRKGQAVGSCDFSGTATQSPNPPSSQTSTCVYPSSSSTNTTSSGTTPSTTPSSTPSSTFPTFGGISPSGTNPFVDGNSSAALSPAATCLLVISLALNLLWSSGVLLRN